MEWLQYFADMFNLDLAQVEVVIKDQLKNNDFLSGGIVVVILTAIATYVRNVPRRIIGHCKRLSHTTMNIHNDEYQSYNRMLRWLGTQPRIMARNRNIQCSDRVGERKFGIGTSWFFYRGRLIRVSRYRKEDVDTGQLSAREGITLTMWGRNQDLLMSLMDKANRLAEGDGIKKTIQIYNAIGSEWKYGGEILKRSLTSVVLKSGVMEGLVNRIQMFRDSQDQYRELGVPHRLGVMLEGPPGTGKTSAILALASHFEAKLNVINLAAMSDSTLTALCGELKNSSVFRFLVFEDADCVFHGRDHTDGDGDTVERVTFSGLLNAIDGLSSGENRVLFMTTNHIEKLDPALIRPGRIDVQLRLDMLDSDQAGRMYERFFDDDGTPHFVNEYTGESAATAQEHLVQRYFGCELNTLCDLTSDSLDV